jgi:choice-of-anchor C domain-containing protein
VKRSFPLRSLAAILACLGPLAGSAHAANLLVNGSFDLGADPGVRMSVPVASNTIQGWTVTTSAIEYVGTGWAAMHGPRSVALNGSAPGAIEQTFATVSGAAYTVKFFLTGDPGTTPPRNVRVSAAGQQQDFAFDAEHVWEWGMGWLEQTFVFSATAATTTLRFASLDAGANGPAIDSVVVTGANPLDAGFGAGELGFALGAPRPSPAPGGAFSVTFAVPVATRDLRLSVLDARGREVRVLAAGAHAAGAGAVTWDGRAEDGSRAAPGVYFVRLLAPDAGVRLVKKGVLL